MSIEPNLAERFSVAFPSALHETATDHLLRHQRAGALQEDLCFALWRQSSGSCRTTALVHELVLPQPGETHLQGNVSFASALLERASERAAKLGSGLALMHSHVGPGWQGMSADDIAAERGRAAFVFSATGQPFLGMTLGIDGAWSARFWPRVEPRLYKRRWCESVRVVGKKLEVTFHPVRLPTPKVSDEQCRTVSAWGPFNQSTLARLHVGVVGVGSVGRLVVEALARVGVQRATFIDFDRLCRINLDRQLGAFREDADAARLKVDVAKEGFERAATAAFPHARAVPAAVTESLGFRAALDCDVVFCCVDRPWGRRVLNHIAYAHLIPVIEGGIVVRTEEGGRFRGAEWSCRTVGPDRRCLACAGAYDPTLVDDERRGLLDDPSYFNSLPAGARKRTSQNVFPFSLSLAGHQFLQFCALVTGLLDMPDLGDQRFRYNMREIEATVLQCDSNCEFQALIATGDAVYPSEAITGPHPAAERMRATFSG